MILIEARANVAEAKKRIASVCSNYEEIWLSEDRAELRCNVEDLAFCVMSTTLASLPQA
jgi:hypothetical protein